MEKVGATKSSALVFVESPSKIDRVMQEAYSRITHENAREQEATMRELIKWPNQIWAAIGDVAIVFVCGLTVGMVEAGSARVNIDRIVIAGIPGAAPQRYNINYWGASAWITRESPGVSAEATGTETANTINHHRSDMIWDNGSNVFDPFTNIYYYQDGDFLFRIPNGVFRPDSAFIPQGWHRKGGVNHITRVVVNSESLTAKGTYGFRLCSGGHCASGVNLESEWTLW